MAAAKPVALILTGFGINCDRETEFAFNLAGAVTRRVHVNDLIDGSHKLSDYQILAFPGGFSFGDDIAAGRVLANKFRTNLGDQLKSFVEEDKLVIGICNGFQTMVKCGLFGEYDPQKNTQKVTLFWNDSGRFEDRWVTVGGVSDKCVFTRGIERLELPVAHGEGKFVGPQELIDDLEKAGRVVLRYLGPDGKAAAGQFPANPNGSIADIAGICDDSGRVFGLMPHPERHLFSVNHPLWIRRREELSRKGEKLPDEGEGRKIFDNAVVYFS
jgi:phosphoribosylformylglycinamidine synthase subunit PurQ / glutaminase